MLLPALVLVFLVGFAAMEKATFENYRVFSVNVTNRAQLEALNQLSDLDGFDFWQHLSFVGRRCDIMVAPHRLADFAEITEKLRLPNQVMVDNVQK